MPGDRFVGPSVIPPCRTMITYPRAEPKPLGNTIASAPFRLPTANLGHMHSMGANT
ncbi:hypothetical protein SAMN05444166_2623 [Singulisphaera sp. GP187]|nr:hypothetical protein SAMN05444166_2623 [Singulisphaera sp. GP187]